MYARFIELSVSERDVLLSNGNMTVERRWHSDCTTESFVGREIEATIDVTKGKMQLLISDIQITEEDIVNIHLIRRGEFIPATAEEIEAAALHDAQVDAREWQRYVEMERRKVLQVDETVITAGILNIEASKDKDRKGIPWKTIEPAAIGKLLELP